LRERVGVRALPHDGYGGVAVRALTLTLSHFVAEGNALGLFYFVAKRNVFGAATSGRVR
jgi:hypothetical protein